MKEYPILFNAEMVRAILDERKTQTRRMIKVQPPKDGYQIATLVDATWPGAKIGNHCWIKAGRDGFADTHEPDFSCPFGSVGDRLWVRETWQTDSSLDRAHTFFSWPVRYIADGAVLKHGSIFGDTNGKVRPSIHMPRWASRILLEITDIRVERLQDISEADAIAEGARSIGCDHIRHSCEEIGCYGNTAKAAFRGIWGATGGDWGANPWVWAITFKRVQP